MEGNQPLFDFQIDHEGKEEFKEISRWSKLQAIVVLAMVFLVLITFAFAWSKIGSAFTSTNQEEVYSGAVLFILIILVIAGTVVGLMMYFLIRSSGRIRTAIRTRDRALLNRGLSDLRTYFAIYGVISILLLFINLISFI